MGNATSDTAFDQQSWPPNTDGDASQRRADQDAGAYEPAAAGAVAARVPMAAAASPASYECGHGATVGSYQFTTEEDARLVAYRRRSMDAMRIGGIFDVHESADFDEERIPKSMPENNND